MLRNFFKPSLLLQNNLRYKYLSNICNDLGLNKLGITKPETIHHNLSYSQLFKHEVKNEEGSIMKCKYGDTFSIETGKFTGRSPNDKWVVKNIGEESDKNIWWGDVNKEITPGISDDLYDKSINHFNSLKECYVFDGYCGTSIKSQKNVRFIHEMAWQQHFVSNMFIRPKNKEELNNFEPDFTIINACSVKNKDWMKQKLNSEVAIAFNIEKKVAIILGTWYGGENKKGIFSLMNYWLPLNNIMSMHCSANIGKNGDSVLFFGLSGTGKTTLSVDPERKLIGDDEHGWDEDGIFNLEGGCYAKTINLSEENEPDIYKAIRKNALLENVYQNEDKTPGYENTFKTENGRVSYPIYHIENFHKLQNAGHPKNIIFLTCDAYGVLPPIAKLSSGQAMYHFLNGYTSKVAGTEIGITEPKATFSACFGEAFLTLHPSKYAELFEKKLNEHDSNVYLVNTGWIGGGYGVGNRISIKNTRKCIDAILTGDIEKCEFTKDEIFRFQIPKELPGLSKKICNPILSWKNKVQFVTTSYMLSRMFQDNYKKYKGKGLKDYSDYGPKIKETITNF